MNCKFLLLVILLPISNIKPLNIIELIENIRPNPKIVHFTCENRRTSYKFFKTANENSNALLTIRNISVEKSDVNNVKLHILHMNCNFSKNILQEASKNDLFQRPNKWILMNFTDDHLPYLHNLNVLVDSDVIVINNKEELLELFKFRPELPSVLRKIDKEDRNRLNLQKTSLKIAIVIMHKSTYDHLEDRRFPELDTNTKVNHALLTHIEEILNSTNVYSFFDTWGYRDNKTGQYSGMMGALLNNSIEIGGTAFTFLAERVKLGTYIGGSSRETQAFIFQQPKLSDIKVLFILPFSQTVWISIGFLILLLIIVLYLTVKFPIKRSIKLLDVITVVFSSFFQQGSSNLPEHFSARLVLIAMFTAFIFFYVSYGANIVALLESSSDEIHNLQDLSHSSFEFASHVMENGFFLAYKHTFDDLQNEVYRHRMEKHVLPLYEGVSRIRKGKTAFHGDKSMIYNVIDKTFDDPEKCGLDEIIFYVPTTRLYNLIQKNCSFGEMLKISFHLLRENGILYRTLEIFTKKKPKCHSRSPFVSADMRACYPLFLLLIFGVFVSIFVLILEIIVHKLNLRKLKNIVIVL